MDLNEYIELHGEQKAAEKIGNTLKQIGEKAQQELKKDGIKIDIAEITNIFIKGIEESVKSSELLNKSLKETDKRCNVRSSCTRNDNIKHYPKENKSGLPRSSYNDRRSNCGTLCLTTFQIISASNLCR